MKRLIYLNDGTWQKADQRRPSNVAKLARLLATSPTQLVRYDAGVGTGWPRIAGGLFGTGIVENIVETYQWLRENYEPGDEIIGIGFSRGASTAREAAGMLGIVGFDLPANEVWRRYRAMYLADNPIPVKAVAVFDTVGARGVPASGGRWFLAPQFDGCNLGHHVEHGLHALALDERRKAFVPTLWTNEPTHEGIKQVWFRGWHSDVGGGCPYEGLSNIPLRWMIHELIACADVEMRHGWADLVWVDYKAPVTPPGRLTRLYGMADRVVPKGATFHHSVFQD